MAEWIWFFCVQTGCAGGSVGEGEREYTLIVEFDEENVLKKTTLVDEKSPCSQGGDTCYQEGQLELAWDKASSLPNHLDGCTLVIYGRTSAMPTSNAWIGIDDGETSRVIEYRRASANKRASAVMTHLAGFGSPIGSLTDRAIVQVPLQEGRYKLNVTVPIMTSTAEPIELRCVRGETYVVRLLWDAKDNASFAFVDLQLGGDEIRGRPVRLLRDR